MTDRVSSDGGGKAVCRCEINNYPGWRCDRPDGHSGFHESFPLGAVRDEVTGEYAMVRIDRRLPDDS